MLGEGEVGGGRGRRRGGVIGIRMYGRTTVTEQKMMTSKSPKIE